MTKTQITEITLTTNSNTDWVLRTYDPSIDMFDNWTLDTPLLVGDDNAEQAKAEAEAHLGFPIRWTSDNGETITGVPAMPRGRCFGCNAPYYRGERVVTHAGGPWHVACLPADVDGEAAWAAKQQVDAIIAAPSSDLDGHGIGCAVADGLACDCK